jgi:hypothetical protein
MAQPRTDDAAMSTNAFLGQPPTMTHQCRAKSTPERDCHSTAGLLGSRSHDPSVIARSIYDVFPHHHVQMQS